MVLSQANFWNKPCSKCDGHGKIQQYAYVENGRCFRCDGSGYFARSHKSPKGFTPIHVRGIDVAAIRRVGNGKFELHIVSGRAQFAGILDIEVDCEKCTVEFCIDGLDTYFAGRLKFALQETMERKKYGPHA